MALGAFHCGGSKSRSVDSVVEVQAVVYLLYSLEGGSTVYTCICRWGRGGVAESSRVSLSNEDDYTALGGGGEKPQGGMGAQNTCL